MRFLGSSCLGVFAALAAGLLIAAGASAAAPEFGRCLKQSGGKFENGACTKEGSVHKFEWSAGVVKNQFTIANKEATLITLETVGGTKLICKGESSPGEFTDTKSLSLTLKFSGCESGSIPCNSAGRGSGTIVTSPLVGTLVVVKVGEPPTKTKLGVEIKPQAGNLFTEFECGPLDIAIRNSLTIGWPANRMASAYTIKSTATKGKGTLEWSTDGGPGEKAGMTATLIVTLEEKVEASTLL